jgi:hypothetical protein
MLFGMTTAIGGFTESGTVALVRSPLMVARFVAMPVRRSLMLAISPPRIS